MRSTIVANLAARFAAYDDLIASIDEVALTQRIDVPRHKSLDAHLWCVIGARESYARALAEGRWAGFANSMTARRLGDYAFKLAASARQASDAIRGVSDWTPDRDALLAQLYEHEVMHEGQIIRHMYGLQRSLPRSWVWA